MYLVSTTARAVDTDTFESTPCMYQVVLRMRVHTDTLESTRVNFTYLLRGNSKGER